MNNSSGKIILLDTGVWYAFYTKSDQYYLEAQKLKEKIQFHRILLPWPICYEVLRTKFVKQEQHIIQFKNDLEKFNIEYLSDIPYREQALKELFSGFSKNYKHENLSLVDILINKVILDKQKRIFWFATTNVKDFEDSCRRRRIELYNID